MRIQVCTHENTYIQKKKNAYAQAQAHTTHIYNVILIVILRCYVKRLFFKTDVIKIKKNCANERRTKKKIVPLI
jgi:hypothetical protein